MNTPLSQRDRVLHALLSGRTLTARQATAALRVSNLRARISEIREMGVEIATENVESNTASGFTASYSMPTGVITRKLREGKRAVWATA